MNKYIILYFICVSFLTHAQQKWTIADAQASQKKLNEEYTNPNESPLTEVDLKDFKHLDFYPISEKIRGARTFHKIRKRASFQNENLYEQTSRI